jgi:hypothetical protein
MGLVERDLEPKLTAITERAMWVYSQHLENAGYTLNRHGEIDVNRGHPHAASGALDENLPAERENFRRFSTNVLSPLMNRFRYFYKFDEDDIGTVEENLGSGTIPPQFTPDHAGEPPSAGDAHSQISYALKRVYNKVNTQLLGIDAVAREPANPPVPVSGNNRDYRERADHYSVAVSSVYWNGPSATAFYVNMSLPFYEAAARQAEYVRELAAAAGAFRNVRYFSAAAINTIADNCLSALHGEGSKPLDWKALGTAGKIIGSAVKLVQGARKLLMRDIFSGIRDIWTGGSGLYASVKSFLAEAGEREPENKSFDLSVTTWHLGIPPHTILQSCDDAITRLMEEIGRYDAAIGEGLEQDMSSVDSFNSSRLWLREPGEFSESQDFGPSSEAIAEDHVDVAVDFLYDAGNQVLPDVADVYGDAVRQVETCDLPSWVSVFLPRSKGDFVAAQGGLVHLLSTTGNNLRMWGGELVEVARGYEETEGGNANTLSSTMN